jgi:hypothetical protein
MKVVKLPQSGGEGQINLKTGLIDQFKGHITRLPVLNVKGAAKYMIHQSLIFKFVTEKTLEASARNKAFDVTQTTLKDFLAYADMKEQVTKTIAFVHLEGTLADAKDRMEKITGCQDVFVTADGSPGKPVEGWLTNIDISKHAKA